MFQHETYQTWQDFIYSLREDLGEEFVDINQLSNRAMWNKFRPAFNVFRKCDGWATVCVRAIIRTREDDETVDEWLKKNCSHKYFRWNDQWFIFEDKNDALLFKITWK